MGGAADSGPAGEQTRGGRVEQGEGSLLALRLMNGEGLVGKSEEVQALQFVPEGQPGLCVYVVCAVCLCVCAKSVCCCSMCDMHI